MNDDSGANTPTPSRTTAPTRSPQQRHLERLVAADGAGPYHTVCQVRLSGPPGPGLDAGPVIDELLRDTGQAPTARTGLAVSGSRVRLVLPAGAADGPTALAVLREVLGVDGPDPDRLRYGAAARWWNELSGGASAGPLREFWRSRARGWDAALPGVAAVPPGPAGQTDDTGPAGPAELTATLDRALVAELLEQRIAPVPCWLLACWQLLLRRHTGLARLVTGVATDLRRHEDLRACRGPLTAYLPVPADTGLDAPLADHVRRAAALLAEGTARAEWFDRAHAVPDDPDHRGHPAGGPGSGSGFSWTELPAGWPVAGGTARVTGLDCADDRFALRLDCQQDPDSAGGPHLDGRDGEDRGGLRLRLAYDARAVPGELAADLLAELPELLAAGLREPDRPAGAVPSVPAGIAERLRGQGRGPAAELPEGGLLALVRAAATAHPEAVAVRGPDRGLSYRQLVEAVDRQAGALRAAGVRPGDLVGVSLDQGADLLVALLGVLAGGAGYVYLDPDQPAARLGTLAAAAGVRLVLTAGADTPVPGVAALPVGGGDQPDGPDAAAGAVGPVGLDAVAYLIHTSGSTGTPKGVLVSHRGLVNYLLGIATDFPAGCRSLVSTPVGFDLALPALYLPLLSGGTVTFAPVSRADAVAELTDTLVREPYDLVRATPSQLRAVHAELLSRRSAGQPAEPLARHVAVGGEPLPADLVAAWAELAPGCLLDNYYGPSETVGARVRGPADAAAAGPAGTVPLGAPIANTGLLVLDGELAPVPLTVTGELYVGGTGLAHGYLGRPADTAARFVPDPAGPPGARMYRTGDLARWLPGRRLEFAGRIDDQVKVRGHRVEPAEVAAALGRHPGVREVVVVDRAGPTGPVLVAYAVPAGDGPVPVDELRRYAAGSLPEYMLPTAVVWLDALPIGPAGKVDRSALPEPGPERPDQSVGYQPPGTWAERVLAEVWAEALGLERVGVHDNFFAVGGDSILSILVASRAARRGLRVSLRHFFQHQTIATMAPHAEPIGGAGPAGGGPGLGLTPAQHWFLAQRMPQPGHWNQGWLLSVPAGVDAEALATAARAVVGHHPALRTRFHRDPDVPGGWRPDPPVAGAPDGADGLRRTAVDGAGWPAGLTAALADLQEIDLAVGPPLRMALLDGGAPDRRRLALIAHHLVIDTVSWQILFEDLRTAYRQVREGRPVELPTATTPPHEWGAALAGALGAAAPALDRWLDQCPPDLPELPVDSNAGEPREADRRELTAVLDPVRTERLLRRMPVNARVDYVLVTAVARAVAGWTGRPEVHVTLEGQGRAQDLVPGVDLYRSVGWFTALAPLLVRLPDAGPLEALRAVREQIHAMPHEGLSYGVLRYLDPVRGERLAARPYPRISVNYVGRRGGTGRPGSAAENAGLDLAPAPEPLAPLLVPASAPRARLWGVNAVVRDDRLHVTVDYAGRHYRPETARRLVDAIAAQLAALIDAWVSDGGQALAPTDFPLVNADDRRAVVARALARAPRPGPATEVGTA